MQNKKILSFLILVLHTGLYAQLPAVIDTTQNWTMTWYDEFDYANAQLDKNWVSQNGSNTHILSSRWRENVEVNNNLLFLHNRKEERGGQQWTSGSIWTKKRFTYGYFECRYKYASATATNNSFWLMSRDGEPSMGKKFEIDINEGHYPNEINTNIHQWSDIHIDSLGKKSHYSHHKGYPFGAKPGYSIQLEIPVKTNKIRFISQHKGHFNIGEFSVYGVNGGNYPDVMAMATNKDMGAVKNLAASQNVKISSSGSYNDNHSEWKLTDGKPNTSWTSQKLGSKWITFEWQNMITVGCIQFLNGWKDNKGSWRNLITDYKLQYLKDGKWVDISTLDVSKDYNFGEEFHTYGLLWNEEELVFYFDGKEIRREKNEFCFSPTPIWLSLAIIKWSGVVTDAIDGTSMQVDYVRYYQNKQKNE